MIIGRCPYKNGLILARLINIGLAVFVLFSQLSTVCIQYINQSKSVFLNVIKEWGVKNVYLIIIVCLYGTMSVMESGEC